ncbi:hypothetical protein Fmac_002107 [Flemingia macrophylla]|uniref:VTT domain-containing protein n=1 Tax=Flemingia macrophylla TaxID=520843 RepID=A0ABD1NKB9_9FABA
MTYFGEDVGGRARNVEGTRDGGEYIKLRWESPPDATITSTNWRRSCIWYWLKSALCFMCVGLLALAAFKWVAPSVVEKVIIPMTKWESNKFSSPVLAVVLFVSIALFPTLFLPSSPSMWVAGMKFGYGFGFLLIISAAVVGVSLPFFIGSMFHRKINVWLEKYPKNASVLRSAGEGNWFHQFRAVALIRISPFPYILYNYCAVATNVHYWPYLCGSLVGMVPEIFISIYTGILIKTLANATHQKDTISVTQIVLNVVGFCVTVATIIFFTVYAKRQLKELQKEEDLLLK